MKKQVLLPSTLIGHHWTLTKKNVWRISIWKSTLQIFTVEVQSNQCKVYSVNWNSAAVTVTVLSVWSEKQVLLPSTLIEHWWKKNLWRISIWKSTALQKCHTNLKKYWNLSIVIVIMAKLAVFKTQPFVIILDSPLCVLAAPASTREPSDTIARQATWEENTWPGH